MTPDEIRERVKARLQEQRDLVGSLLRQRAQLAGSLFARYAVCGKEGCVCRTGQKHGPYYVLSTRSAGRGGFSYLDAERLGEARELVKAYREFRADMRRLRRVNEQLVVLLRRFQEASMRQGSRRVGVAPQAQA